MKNQGLIVLGVHSPEFEFERRVDNVRLAAMNVRVAFAMFKLEKANMLKAR